MQTTHVIRRTSRTALSRTRIVPILVAGICLLCGSELTAGGVPLTAAVQASGVTLESKRLDIAALRIVHERGAWTARHVPPETRILDITIRNESSLSPTLGEIRMTLIEGEQRGTLTLWVTETSDQGEEHLAPFLLRVESEDVAGVIWDIGLRFGSGPMRYPDKDRATLWIYRNAAHIDDTALLVAAAENVWHNPDLDDPPGSFNRIIDLNKRLLDIDPHAVDTYGTTAWLLWSKWVTWTQDPASMPDGATKVDEALALLARGDKANPGNAHYLFEAGSVLIPLVQYHRQDLRPVLEDYLRRAAKGATSPPSFVVKARRTYASHLFMVGEVAKARYWYRRVLDVDPDNEVATRRLRRIAENPGIPAAPIETKPEKGKDPRPNTP